MYLIALRLDIGLDFWEIQDAGQIERHFNIKMDPEKRRLAERVEVAVKF